MVSTVAGFVEIRCQEEKEKRKQVPLFMSLLLLLLMGH